MKKLLLFILPILFYGSAEAARLDCNGETMGYHYFLRANVRANRVVGPVRAGITGGVFAAGRSATMRVTSSMIRPGSFLRVSGYGSGITGTLNSRFDPSSRTYVGSISVRTTGYSGSGGITCRLSGVRPFDAFNEESEAAAESGTEAD